jgi:ABC-type proline/glycine betaine transport system ATPase subunit
MLTLLPAPLQLLHRHFADRTILTIAHRLDTIIRSDKILVLEAGRVVEFAPPATLLADEASAFSGLCKRTGPAKYRALAAAAAAAAANANAAAAAAAGPQVPQALSMVMAAAG